MAKRKHVKIEATEDSDLSPAPDGLIGDAPIDNPAHEAPPSKKRKVKAEKEVKQEVTLEEESRASPTKSKKKGRTKKDIVAPDTSAPQEDGKATKKAAKSSKQAVQTEEEHEAEAEGDGGKAEKVKRKRKTKEEKEAEAMPLAARTVGHKLFIGAHVSSGGGKYIKEPPIAHRSLANANEGVHNAPLNSVHIGANAFALFLKSQRKWANPPLVDDHCTSFHDHCKSQTYDQNQHVVPHGSYLVNLAHVDKTRTEQAYEAFLDDLQRCEKLGIGLYNFHPGVANSADRATSIAHLASNLNRAHAATSSVVTLLENMAHGGNTLGSTFEDLRDTIALVSDKKRVGVCLDTCHAFAGGYDLRTPTAFAATMQSFDEIVGVQYLRAVHMNDSKAPFASHRDLHANIGTGFLGLRAFHNLVNDPRFAGLPLILETPIDATDEDGLPVKDEKGKEKEDKNIWAGEIKLLESLVGMDTESEEFLNMEKKLARKGEPERKRLFDQIERKKEKDAAKAEKAEKKRLKKGGTNGVKAEHGESEDSALSELEDDEEGR